MVRAFETERHNSGNHLPCTTDGVIVRVRFAVLDSAEMSACCEVIRRLPALFDEDGMVALLSSWEMFDCSALIRLERALTRGALAARNDVDEPTSSSSSLSSCGRFPEAILAELAQTAERAGFGYENDSLR